ncbi:MULTISPECIES: septum formation family protein [unclassified Arthrobacter]|uniref:septum formation family protein n=1 Tax=unclassified Arthrobacter TaxID=235627 RepID=UPI001E632166|nr:MULTISPECIES: septum formation family protein [unclassified Arthrobacter]MCC9144687.1 septum formation family protein [Arthrobacter sp. zg-Y919]MDK1275913.1 septum formation family protein [Arthrobacter sp. zg.Y919]WIB02731.1 septum formation family protein [Arthrobacter sp. zg-Y919]
MSDQKNTPAAGFPPPEKDSTPGAFPDLSAHSDSPAWLSEDGNHDAGVWERSFEGVADGEMPAADAKGEDRDGAAGEGGDQGRAAGDETPNADLPAEPVVVAPEDLELEEPSLADPALGEDAVEAAELDEVASETAAVEANAAEAGRLSGLEPAPAGAEIPVNTEGSGTAVPEDTVAPEDTAIEAEAESGSEAAGSGAGDDAGDDAANDAANDNAEGSDTAGAPETAADGEAGTEAAGQPEEVVESADEKTDSAGETAADLAKDTEAKPEKDAQEPGTPAESGTENTVDAGQEPTADTVIRVEAVEKPAAEPHAGGADALHGINAAAPVTGALPDQEPKAVDAAASPAATAAVPAGETRRSRRLAESQAAAAAGAAARKPAGTSTDVENPGADRSSSAAGMGTPAGGAQDPAKDGGRGKRNTRLLLVIGGVVLAAVIAILLFVFVFNDKEEGVLSEDVSPIELEAGACLQDWDDVNSSATVVTCETPHDAQLVATDSFTEDAAFPGTGALEERVDEVCAAVKYSDAATQFPGLKLTKSIPTEQTWATGDRRVDCFVFAPEGQELTESLLAE